ncbi:olfactory receptor 867-like [Megalops cyprinoides]|uniref:olfactory receptor 867-like n=1 Tax=Megalops cyprinoides TaxID=118141 RepID=UPI001864BC94|nr:olfactory receptor 867-like [Megalops cyprinoides]
MDNITYNSPILHIEAFDLPPKLIYPVFFILFFFYLIIMITNIGVILLISSDRNLQQPMYLLFCNLSFNDILGNTVLLPRLMSDVVSSDRSITYVECVSQAFFSHIFGTSAHTILIIMAFDRYVAICHPLRYTSIMTPGMVVKLSLYSWGAAVVLVSVLLGLTIRLTRCRSIIQNAYCDNASLFKLSCQDVTINNIYGLAFTVVLFGSSMGSIAITYIRIVTICITKKSKELNSKALQTCATHLVLYMIMLWSGFLVIMSHRLQIHTDYRKLASVLFHIVPANLNPIIYAAQTKELKNRIAQLFNSKATPA